MHQQCDFVFLECATVHIENSYDDLTTNELNLSIFLCKCSSNISQHDLEPTSRIGLRWMSMAFRLDDLAYISAKAGFLESGFVIPSRFYYDYS